MTIMWGGCTRVRMWMCTHIRTSVGSSCAKDYGGDWEMPTMLGQGKLPQVEKELNM